MVEIEQVAELAIGLPQVWEATSYGHRAWFVGGHRGTSAKGRKKFAWLRRFSQADLDRFGDRPVPDGDILAVRVGDLGEKEAVLAAARTAFFTMPHFEGYPAVLIQLRCAERQAVAAALEDGWLACAPATLVEDYLAAP